MVDDLQGGQPLGGSKCVEELVMGGVAVSGKGPTLRGPHSLRCSPLSGSCEPREAGS